MSASIFTRAADFAHKTVVFGLVSLTGFQVYQLVKHSWAGQQELDPAKSSAAYVEEVRKLRREESLKDHANWSPDFRMKDEEPVYFRPESTKPKKNE
jgi:hypothetical protein